MNPARYLVFGLPASGKTTFAAALWHLLDSREVTTALAKGKHIGEFRYLEEIAQSWCEGWQVKRTDSEQVEDVRINLSHPGSGTELVLEFSDLSGESLEKAFATRHCTSKFVELVGHASGLLLFVSADRIVDEVTILDALGGLGALEEEEDRTETPWDPSKTPQQVRLVDLIQALRLDPFGRKPFRVAVIVSAWDLSDEKSADDWLAKKFSLLDQYLRSGEGALEMRVYGVSAQGGQLSKKGDPPGPDRDRLLALDVPSKRIKVVGHNAAEHDLTHPLLWLSGLDEKA